MVKAGPEHRFLEQIRGWHQRYGKTFKANMGGRNAVFTVDPANLQAVLATKFGDFELGNVRNKAARKLLGYGIFTTDGSEWAHSRAMLRPTFTRSQIGKTEIYELHVQELLKCVPCDGSTVDLQRLFFRMVRIRH